MNSKLKQLTQKVRRLNDPCGDCSGRGEVAPFAPKYKDTFYDCHICDGKGYVEELENLGKPLTLREILLALGNGGCYYISSFGGLATEDSNGVQLIDGIDIDLTLQTEEYPKALLDQLIKLL